VISFIDEIENPSMHKICITAECDLPENGKANKTFIFYHMQTKNDRNFFRKFFESLISYTFKKTEV